MPSTIQPDIAANLAQVELRIGEVCARAGRRRDEITLVAVTKMRSAEQIRSAYRCGLRHFGENRIEEAETKVPELRTDFADDPATWHMVGHVQSRKAKRAAAFADVIHSVDSLRLARRLDRFAAQMAKSLPILVEVNVSGEASKYGYPAWDPATLAAFVSQAREFEALIHLQILGLMTMAPIVADVELARPVFRRLACVRHALRDQAPFSAWSQLSMGMTDDFEVAIEEGATMVRIGRAIFGPRPHQEEDF